MNNIYQLSKTFLKSDVRGLQFDFFQNSQVVLQIFKGYDVINWQFKPKEVNNNEIVFQLLFNNGKDNNKQNLIKFKNSSLFKNFEYVNFYKQDSYFLCMDLVDENKLIYYIEEIIKEVYSFDIHSVQLTLKAY